MPRSEALVPLTQGVLGVLHREQRKRMYAERPDIWALDILGAEMWSGQVEIVMSVVKNKNTMVAAGHGVGKSWVTSVLACWWIDTHEIGKATVLSTAPSTSQVRNVLWKSIQNMHSLSKKRYEKYRHNLKRGLSTEGLPDHPLPGRITTQATWKTDDGIPIGFGRTPPRGREGDSFQGIHGNVLAIADEAVGCSEDMIQTLANNTSNMNDRRLLIANPTNPASSMGQTWHDEKASKAWERITISVLSSPKFTDEHKTLRADTLADMVDQTYVDDKKLEYGEDSANYKARVLGQWALDTGMILFPIEVLETGKETVVIPDENGKVHFGFDVARSEKGDYSFIYMAREGWVYQTRAWIPDEETGEGDWIDFETPIKTEVRGIQVRFIDSWRGLPFQPLHNGQGQRVESGANERVDALVREWQVDQLRVDADGMGSLMIDAMFDVMRDDYEYEIIEMHSNDPSPNRNAHYNNRAFQYSELARKMRQGTIDIDPADTKLIEQLGGIEYKIANGFAESILIEKKSELRKRGIKSPDAADAAWYAVANIDHLFESEQVGTRIDLDVDAQLAMDGFDHEGFFAMEF